MRNFDFRDHFDMILRGLENSAKLELKAPKKMRTFEESTKSQKTVRSMKIDPKKELAKTDKNKTKTGTVLWLFRVLLSCSFA